jgi:hypothetical protein
MLFNYFLYRIKKYTLFLFYKICNYFLSQVSIKIIYYFIKNKKYLLRNYTLIYK